VTTTTFAQLGPNCSPLIICGLVLIAGFGGGFAWVAGTAAGYVGLPEDRISHAAPLLSTVMRLGASFGTALAAIVLQRELDAGPATQAHLVTAFHSTFAWAVGAVLLAVVMLIALSRSEPAVAVARPRQDTSEFETIAAI